MLFSDSSEERECHRRRGRHSRRRLHNAAARTDGQPVIGVPVDTNTDVGVEADTVPADGQVVVGVPIGVEDGGGGSDSSSIDGAEYSGSQGSAEIKGRRDM